MNFCPLRVYDAESGNFWVMRSIIPPLLVCLDKHIIAVRYGLPRFPVLPQSHNCIYFREQNTYIDVLSNSLTIHLMPDNANRRLEFITRSFLGVGGGPSSSCTRARACRALDYLLLLSERVRLALFNHLHRLSLQCSGVWLQQRLYRYQFSSA